MQWFLDFTAQPGGYLLPVFILALMLCLTLVAMVAVGEWGKLRRAQLQANLTQAMIQRGMSAAEILQTLAASRELEFSGQCVQVQPAADADCKDAR
jgi:hypothetical protein